MKPRALQRLLPLLLLTGVACAQIPGDQLGTHDLTPAGASPMRGPISNACLYCHAPHGGQTAPAPLWNQQLSVQTYTMYGSSTFHQTAQQPPLGSPSKLCLSCHDGTVAPGQTVSFGQLNMSGAIKSTSRFGTDLTSSHPFSLRTPLVDTPDVNALLFAATPRTADPAVKLVKGSIECTSCHQPHFQAIDKIVQKFLVREGAGGMLCLACHDPARVAGGQTNRLAGWGGSIHASATNTTANSPYVGGYRTVAQNACSSCHMPHNAAGPARLLRGAGQQACLNCHAGANTAPAAPNIASELAKVGHPAPAGNAQHDPAEAAVLNNNRHATCADCHDPHAAQATASFTAPPALRPAQNNAVGVSATDGMTALRPALNQYEVCLRCHGTSVGKTSDSRYGYLPRRATAGSDPLNVMLQLAGNPSSHPVTHDRVSVLPQPSLRANLVKLDGVTAGRAMGTRLFCTDCHNADDNRESGGAGPNGPHGSQWTHLLERRYEIAQAATPGNPIINLFPNPDRTVSGPYALCAKCHDLGVIFTDDTAFKHKKHIDKGFSCSACHSAHGSNGSYPQISGERLVTFDLNVVAPRNGVLSYNRATRSCTLTCHNKPHNNAAY